MNPLVQSWLTALRSNTYRQITGQLRAYGGFCALGVACDVYDKYNHPFNSKWDPTGFNDATYTYLDGNDGLSMPIPVQAEFGISDELEKQIQHLNDDTAADFQQIADYIEEQLNGAV